MRRISAATRFEQGTAIAVDGAGNAYVAGYTLSSDFPTVSAYDRSLGKSGDVDVFVTKLNAAGTATGVVDLYRWCRQHRPRSRHCRRCERQRLRNRLDREQQLSGQRHRLAKADRRRRRVRRQADAGRQRACVLDLRWRRDEQCDCRRSRRQRVCRRQRDAAPRHDGVRVPGAARQCAGDRLRAEAEPSRESRRSMQRSSAARAPTRRRRLRRRVQAAAFVGGWTASDDFPTVNPLQSRAARPEGCLRRQARSIGCATGLLHPARWKARRRGQRHRRRWRRQRLRRGRNVFGGLSGQGGIPVRQGRRAPDQLEHGQCVRRQACRQAAMRSCTRRFSAAKSARRCARSRSDHCRSTGPTPPMASPSMQAGTRTSPESRARTRFRSSTRRPHASRRTPTTRRSSRRSACRGHRCSGRRSCGRASTRPTTSGRVFPPVPRPVSPSIRPARHIVTGDADSFSDFKPTAGAFQTTNSNNQGAVIVKFAAVPSMTLSTSDATRRCADAVDAEGDARGLNPLRPMSCSSPTACRSAALHSAATSATLTTTLPAGIHALARRSRIPAGIRRHAHRLSGRRHTACLQLTQ